MKQKLALWNMISILAVIIVNGLVATKGVDGQSIKDMSDTYENLFTPAPYAFGIWSLIFLALLIHGLYQLKTTRQPNSEDTVLKMGYWLIIANICNCLWLFVFLKNWTLLSVVVMLVLLYSLIQIILNLNMQLHPATKEVKWYTWAPMSL